MDGESFDRLSVIVNRLRDRSSRRDALRALLGGSAAVAAAALADDDADARKKNRKKRCRGYGATCHHHKDCCNGSCRYGRCWYTGNGGGGGGKHCGGRTCPSGWSCCRQSGVHVCVPSNYPTCCGGYSYANGYYCCNNGYGACYSGGECCPGGSGTGCCQDGWKCCGNGRCCPRGWDCGDFVCTYNQYQDAEIAGESVQTIPSVEAQPVPDADRIALDAIEESVSKP
jgi:hypothetical protein